MTLVRLWSQHLWNWLGVAGWIVVTPLFEIYWCGWLDCSQFIVLHWLGLKWSRSTVVTAFSGTCWSGWLNHGHFALVFGISLRGSTAHDKSIAITGSRSISLVCVDCWLKLHSL